MSGIVVGVDGSTYSERALGWAMREAALRQMPLTVLTVRPTIISHATGQPVVYPGDDTFLETARQAVEEEVEKVSAQLGEARPVSVSVRAVVGFPAQELINASHDADMVIVGSRGGGGFARLLMGSVSSQVVHHAACPVVVVPHERHER